MDTLKLINNLIKHAENNTVDNICLTETLRVVSNEIAGLKKDSEIKSSLELINGEIKQELSKLKQEKIKNEKILNKALGHIEFLDPLFEEFKKKSIGRLRLINLSDDVKEDLENKIKKADYSDEIFQILQSIELRTKDVFKEKTPLKINAKVINYNDFK